MTTDTPLLIHTEGGIARLRFNRPGVLNALDVATAQAFAEACRDLARDATVRVVVLSGEGRAFVAGGDLAAMRADPVRSAATIIDAMHEGIAILSGLPAPVLASLHGAVAGGGLGLALAADLAIAAEGTRFNLAYANIGTSCDCSSSWGLPRLVGLRKAMEIALLSDVFDAAEALRLGIVNRVVPAADLAAETDRLAERLARGAPHAFGRLKRLMRESFGRDLEGQLAAERTAFLECAATRDFGEGLTAFFEKRVARYEGR
ncbi:MAG: enoyl-CoA hydratase-related protein [Burkholderiales bacterium]